ncbi:MAG: HpcH/HpaI aldolase family protein [Anaerolineales bacterium]|jgi:2-dehydro-3-deoxyglucarate aldolase/4-hydroxy-2-oxoheptanedioate aldolase
MKKGFRERLLGGESLIGTLISLPSPEIAELLANCGFDWLFIDLEHGPISYLQAQRMIMSAGPKTSCVLRVPVNDEEAIKKTLDLGPSGIIIPQLRTKKDAEQAVRLTRFPPAGERSVGIARAHGYGMEFQEYVERANRDTALILQVEHITAVENIDAILDVPGFDALLVGPYDLSGSMGMIGELENPQLRASISTIRQRCLEASMPVGIFSIDPHAAREYLLEGFRLLVIGTDTLLLGNAAVSALKELKNSA